MSLELWGGVECTVNRVGPKFFDQLIRSGHHHRLDDLDRFASLGLKALRYPVLWERVQPNGPDEFDWEWSDIRLGRLRELAIRPIVGLLHHGSGPAWTSLLDPEFPAKLARYAFAFAQRYPWVDSYVPVNEPLTTARFSGLYGHWYPHRKDNTSFVQALLNQIEGISLSMAAVRSLQPTAKLIQTEDLGKTFSTPALRYQADFENERRWITFDLLTGRVVEGHPMWAFLLENGAGRSRLDGFSSQPCPPDIHGVNYYVTSERYLDESVDDYSPCSRGGNVFQAYADVDAVRARPEGLMGVGFLLHEMWKRYGAPMAVTEAHMACTREEQIRWFVEIWNQCHYLADNGIDCRAVTAWALLGAYDWNSLVMDDRGRYESGAFDLQTGIPQPTAVARMIRTIAVKNEFTSPILRMPGWWRRPERLLEHHRPVPLLPYALPGQPILVVGAEKAFAEVLGQVCEHRGLAFRLMVDAKLDLGSLPLLQAVERNHPWAIIEASGLDLSGEAGPKNIPSEETTSTGVTIESSLQHGTKIRLFVLSNTRPVQRDPHSASMVLNIEDRDLQALCHGILNALVDSEIGLWRPEFIACFSCSLRN